MTRKHDGSHTGAPRESHGSLARHAQLARRAGHLRYLAKDLDRARNPSAARHGRYDEHDHSATY
jgi:hypothetical protein